ncbi:MAG: DUF47 family protein [Methanomassiliicoccus sp.]|nr:DUF47 family protein [Methanomassiliicoccus sp.]
MRKVMEGSKNKEKGKLLDSIFPPKYDFLGMLFHQAELTEAGVRALNAWMIKGDLSHPPTEVEEIERQADDARRYMEGLLLEAFSTPFDRQDIYSFSRQMDNILNFCLSTAVEMRAFGVAPDKPTKNMAAALQRGTEMVKDAVMIMPKDPARAQAMIREMRRNESEIEKTYVADLAVVFSSSDPIEAMKKREVYHHLKDAGRALSITIDILHRIIVEMG